MKQQILDLIYLALAAAFPFVSGLILRALLHLSASLRAKLDASTKNQLAANAIGHVIHLAEAMVLDLEATVRPELGKALADGRLDDTERAYLKNLALTRLKAVLGERGKQELLDFLGVASGQLDTYLSGVVEGAVAKMKAPAPATP